MPNNLLQWEAIKLSKANGCEVYDLWGAPDVFDESDGMWGVYRFKKGMGAYPVQRLGAYDLPIKKFAYKIFMQYLPRIQMLLLPQEGSYYIQPQYRKAFPMKTYSGKLQVEEFE